MKNRLYTTASLVTVLSVAERALGFLYRIVLSRLIGAEGLGIYQIALSLFGFFLTLGTGGIPITVSRMISKSKAENDAKSESGAVSAGVFLSLLLCLPVCLLFFLLGDKMQFLFSDARSLKIFKILLLGLTLSSIYAVFRGYFWGNKKLLLPSIIEIAEEAVMVIFGILLLQNVASPEDGAVKAAKAVLISYVFSFTVSLLCFLFQNGKFSNPKPHLKPLFNTSLPITSVRASGSLVTSAIAVLLPAMLIRAGAGEAEALKLFGIVSGMVLPVLFIPSTIIGSLSLVLVPELSEDYYRKNYARLRKNVERGLRFSFLVACILIPFFYALGKDVGSIAFASKTAGKMIFHSAPILLPMSITMISTGILNAMGAEKQTFVHYFIGAGALLLCILLLPPLTGVYAYPIGLFISYLLNAAFNLILLWKKGLLFEKGDKQVGNQRLFISLALIPALSFVGVAFSKLYNRFFSAFPSVLLTTLCLGIITLVLYVLFRILPIFKEKSLIFKDKKS